MNYKRKEVIGDCVLYLGDNREVVPYLQDVGAILIDPPYGIGMDKGVGWDRETPDLDFMLKLQCPKIIWGGNYFNLPCSRGWLVWHKPDSVPTMADAELAWTSMDMNVKYIKQSIAATNAERVNHPTQKPLRVMQWCINFLPNNNTTILDCYLGSGTTLVACAKMGRKGIGIEIDENYFNIACKRVEDAYKQPDMFVEQPKKKPEQGNLTAL